MATFLANLAANPQNSSVYQGPGSNFNPDQESGAALRLFNQIRDRDMNDYKEKANFMSDLSLKQDRLRRIFDQQNPEQQPQQAPMMMRDPNAMNEYQKGELGIRQQGMDVERAKLAQQDKFGQEALDVKNAQEKLNQQKSDQINALKQAENERKINDANERIRVSEEKLKQTGDNFKAQLDAHNEHYAAMEERHKLELAQKDQQFRATQTQHQQTIDALKEKIKQQGSSDVIIEQNPDGTKRTISTRRGSAANKVRVDGPKTAKNPDGRYDIPADRVDEWNQNHANQPDQIEQDQTPPDEGKE